MVTATLFYRHVLRDIAPTTLIVGVVLLILLLTNQLAFVLGRAASGQIPAAAVWELLGLSVVENAVVVLPIAVLLGILLGLGRLYHDSEIAAAQACGMGARPLYVAAGTVVGLATLLAAVLAFIAAPRAAERAVAIRTEALKTAVTRGLEAGQFRSLGDGVTLYVGARDADGSLRNVFVQREVSPSTPETEAADGDSRLGSPPQNVTDTNARIEVVVAERARYDVSQDSQFYTITLFDGESRLGVPGQAAWRILKFKEQVLRLPTPEATLPGKPRVDLVPTSKLWRARDLRQQGELHWRIASVVVTLALGLLAVPLSRLQPRQGRYARVVWALLLYAIYTYLLILGRTLLERGQSPVALGLWWAHAAAIAIGLLFVFWPELRQARARRAERRSAVGATRAIS